MPKTTQTSENSLALFQEATIRRVWQQEQWYFSIIDVIAALTGSENPRRYWSDLKIKLREEGSQIELYEKIVQLKMIAPDGKSRETDSGNTETLLRIVQSIPSPHAEPFKQWLAQVGHERIQEINDPELAMKRMRAIYEAKGYPSDWIDKRERGIAVRQTLTDEWKERGVREGLEYAILTDEIYRAAFGMGAKEYKAHKGITRENLRDHMSDLELIFTMLGEASTTEISATQKLDGLENAKIASKKGGKIAGDARKNLEKETGQKIVSEKNYIAPLIKGGRKKNKIGGFGGKTGKLR